ncbi:recombinase-like helix-turn-helix domain-containing protein [Acinetobacter sp. MB5]|uniref:recombinase-like helix-turn-helix domain-containing protein n=1 Tax=Acinetobacter sp. MB5 TaxID=2069438 RepID=UPI000DCF8D75|nr:recombinase-like helix-turn-helix domain-containing protein [Acinetobacter sp. MB5]
MKTFNEKLASWIHATPASEAGINNIQIPGQSELLVWQTRYKEPTVYEQDFVTQLMDVFSSGVTELDDVVQALNQQGFRSESGEKWTTETFSEEMQRLGY